MPPKHKRLLLQKKTTLREQIAKLREMIFATNGSAGRGLEGEQQSLHTSKEDDKGSHVVFGAPKSKKIISKDGTGRLGPDKDSRKCRRAL